jgi:non-canonical purine NTP pyrophosphatase (RdgB/HAM1 family)
VKCGSSSPTPRSRSCFPSDLGLWVEAAESSLELGDTFAQNARSKAEYFAKRTGLPTLADDSGLEVLSLGGEPGVRSKRWSGVTGPEVEIDKANNAMLLRRLAGAPEARRRARYRCVLAYCPKFGAMTLLFEGACTGRILEEPVGTGGFGYDPLFFFRRPRQELRRSDARGEARREPSRPRLRRLQDGSAGMTAVPVPTNRTRPSWPPASSASGRCWSRSVSPRS